MDGCSTGAPWCYNWMVGWMRWPSGGVRNRAPYAAHNLKLRSPMITFELKQLSLFIYFLMKLEFTAFLQKASEANIWMERSVILRNYM